MAYSKAYRRVLNLPLVTMAHSNRLHQKLQDGVQKTKSSPTNVAKTSNLLTIQPPQYKAACGILSSTRADVLAYYFVNFTTRNRLANKHNILIGNVVTFNKYEF